MLNTSAKKWDATRTMKQNENNLYRFPTLNYPKYNVIDINDYTIDELIEKRTGVGLSMAFEKARTKEECLYILKKLKDKNVNQKEIRAIRLMAEYIDEVMIGKTNSLTKDDIEEVKKIMKEIIKGEGDLMSNFEKLLLKIAKENEKAMEEGKIEGRKEGRKFGEEIIKALFKNNMSAEEISQKTGIELAEILKIVNC